MTDDLTALLTTELDRLEATSAAADAPDEVVLDDDDVPGVLMASIVEPEPGTATPMIVAHADTSPELTSQMPGTRPLTGTRRSPATWSPAPRCTARWWCGS